MPGRLIPASDATSRNPAFRFKSNGLHEEKEAKYDEAYIITDEMEISTVALIKLNDQQIQAVTWEIVRRATKEDPYMRMLSDTIANVPNKASCLPQQLLQLYWQYKNNLQIEVEVIMYRDKIIMPPKRFASLLILLIRNVRESKENTFLAMVILKHPKHKGEMQHMLRVPKQPHLPAVEPIIPTSSFEATASDYFKLHGHSYLVFVDRFRNWLHIAKVKHGPTIISAKELIRALIRTFVIFGVQIEISSDGGPEYIAEETVLLSSRKISVLIHKDQSLTHS